MKFLIIQDQILITERYRIFLNSAFSVKEDYIRVKFPAFNRKDEDLLLLKTAKDVYSIQEIIELPFSKFSFNSSVSDKTSFLKDTFYYSFLIPYFINFKPPLDFEKEEEYYYMAMPMYPYLAIDVLTKPEFKHGVHNTMKKEYHNVRLQKNILMVT